MRVLNTPTRPLISLQSAEWSETRDAEYTSWLCLASTTCIRRSAYLHGSERYHKPSLRLGERHHFGSSLVWATVSLGVSIVFSLSWPAFIRATDDRQNVRAFIILVGLLLTGTYSVSAALGSAYGGRVQASTVQTDRDAARVKADTAYKAAKAELDTLAAARTRAELDPQIRTLKSTKSANNCETRDGPISRKGARSR